MPADFTWTPDQDSNLTTGEFRVRVHQFDSGYVQIAPLHLNPLKRSFQLRFQNRDMNEVQDIVDFIVGKKGQPFTMDLYLPESGLATVRCLSYQTGSPGGLLGSVSLTLEEVNNPV